MTGVNAEEYKFLAPLPGTGTTFDPTSVGGKEGSDALGKYLNAMIKLFIGVCAVLAVIMIVLGGIEYMTSELPGNKESGKKKITQAIFGLLLALGAWVILNTINPNLLNTKLESLGTVTVEVALDEANLEQTEGAQAKTIRTFATSGSTSAGVSAFVDQYCSSLSKITVNTSSKRASFCSGSNCVSVPINVGYKGVSELGTATAGDNKTPKGTTKITGDIRGPYSNGNAALSGNEYNLGVAFINIGATSTSGANRGIGFHGSYNNNLGTTNGCVRMTNDDLAALAPCMKTGTTVTIQ